MNARPLREVLDVCVFLGCMVVVYGFYRVMAWSGSWEETAGPHGWPR